MKYHPVELVQLLGGELVRLGQLISFRFCKIKLGNSVSLDVRLKFSKCLLSVWVPKILIVPQIQLKHTVV